RPRPAWMTLATVCAVATVAALVGIAPPRAATTRTLTLQTTGPPVGGTPGVQQTLIPGSTTGAAPVFVAPPGVACAPGRNGGATDTGVTASTIKLGATVVDSGIGATFLRDARFGMLAIKNKVNRAGGICGRKIDLVLVDDGWEFARGGEFLRNLVEDRKVFALAVVPSSEGLKNISDAGYLRRKRIPVVGSDGMLIHQYRDPFIWPVAASTISTMHIMAKHAFDTGARNFAIVYEHKYRFGPEGAYAFNEAVKKLTGRGIEGYSDPIRAPRCSARFCGLNPDAGSYRAEIETFNSACLSDPRCDFVALLLQPSTALKWLTGGALSPSQITMGGPQPLFTRSFAQECRSACDGLTLWTGFEPPIGGNLGRPEISEFVRDINLTSSSADPTNTFAQGAYVGMSLMVDALRRVGSHLTRERLMAALDSTTFQSGLARTLTWRAGNHYANTRMKAYSIRFRDRFVGWTDDGIELSDPWVGQHIPG
ncbi:MAG: ABC transporter substrate-binding protein, partial [Actinomycetota bacterium]